MSDTSTVVIATDDELGIAEDTSYVVTEARLHRIGDGPITVRGLITRFTVHSDNLVAELDRYGVPRSKWARDYLVTGSRLVRWDRL